MTANPRDPAFEEAVGWFDDAQWGYGYAARGGGPVETPETREAEREADAALQALRDAHDAAITRAVRDTREACVRACNVMVTTRDERMIRDEIIHHIRALNSTPGDEP